MPEKEKEIVKEDQENKIGMGIILWDVFFMIAFVAGCIRILVTTIKAKMYILTVSWILLLLFTAVLAVICGYEDLSDEEKEDIRKLMSK